MKLNYKRIILVGFAFFLIQAFWQAYDNTIPMILTNKFGMSQAWSGAIMALDNVLALFMLPLFGAISDKHHSKWGRRTPFIVVGTLIAAVMLIALSFVDNAQLHHISDVAAIDDPAALETIYDREADETLLTPGGQKFVLSRQFTKEEFTQIRSQITVDGVTRPLEEPFLVIATQNPLEQEGTYPLPEAQVDRFMLKARITYPKKQEERDIMRLNMLGGGLPKPNRVIAPEDILKAREVVSDVYMDEKIEKYIVDIIFATREPSEYNMARLASLISYGGSPRASISLAKAAKSYAFIKRRGYVIPEDVRAVCHDVLRHRIGLTYEAEAENVSTEEIVTEILNNVEVP